MINDISTILLLLSTCRFDYQPKCGLPPLKTNNKRCGPLHHKSYNPLFMIRSKLGSHSQRGLRSGRPEARSTQESSMSQRDTPALFFHSLNIPNCMLYVYIYCLREYESL